MLEGPFRRVLLNALLWPILAATEQAHTLSGTVYGGSDTLPNAHLTLSDASSGAQVATTTTDAGGDYTLTATNGTFNLSVDAPQHSGFGNTSIN